MGDFPKLEILSRNSEQRPYGSVPSAGTDDTKCNCGHLASSHRTYGCIGWSGGASTKQGRVYCECKAFKGAAVKKSA